MMLVLFLFLCVTASSNAEGIRIPSTDLIPEELGMERSSARQEYWNWIGMDGGNAINGSSAHSAAYFPDLYVPRTGDKDVVMMPALLVLGMAAVLVVLVTVNVTCLFMQRQRGKEQNVRYSKVGIYADSEEADVERLNV